MSSSRRNPSSVEGGGRASSSNDAVDLTSGETQGYDVYPFPPQPQVLGQRNANAGDAAAIDADDDYEDDRHLDGYKSRRMPYYPSSSSSSSGGGSSSKDNQQDRHNSSSSYARRLQFATTSDADALHVPHYPPTGSSGGRLTHSRALSGPDHFGGAYSHAMVIPSTVSALANNHDAHYAPPPHQHPHGPSTNDHLLQDDDSVNDNAIRYEFRRKNSSTFRRVQHLGRHAALTTKQQLWDSNDRSIDAALSAVDQWETAYTALRHLLIGTAHSAKGLWGAAKEGAGKLEHGLLMPVRDWILLPTIGGMERAAQETVSFLQSNAAQQLYGQSLTVIESVPFVGENVLAPALHLSVNVLQRTWEIAQYPIPSKQQVRDSVDFALNGTKWALSAAGKEVYLYIKRADANITRTLSTTQWKVLGSGPYATLDKLNKREVIDHLCERYFSLTDPVARYELAAHVRHQNRPLYHDLVLTGVLKDRGNDLTKDDEWLSTCPSYRSLEQPFLVRSSLDGDDESSSGSQVMTSPLPREILPLWFRLPNVNGNPPSKDTPWICFRRKENIALEKRYLQVVREGQRSAGDETEADATSLDASAANLDSSRLASSVEEAATPLKSGSGGQSNVPGVAPSAPPLPTESDSRPQYPTIAKWYEADKSADVLVDQKRAAVSFFLCCPKCRSPRSETIPPLVGKSPDAADLCDACRQQEKEMPSVAALLSPPPISMKMRPTFWRFHGPGDTVRRGTWFLDTARNGLQPFDEEAAATLEDAFLFLKWMSVRQAFEADSDMDAALLTVEVPCPDGTERLVQFSSVTRATAIQKGLGASVSLFKRRVYRGAWLEDKSLEERERDQEVTVEESILQAVETNGSLGDTMVPDMALRDALTPAIKKPENRLVLFTGTEDATAAFAVPPAQLDETMSKYLDDEKDGRIDHLVLIVHGIGEMLRSIDVFGLSLPNLSSIVDCCRYLRNNHAEVQDAHFSQMYPTADAIALAETGRVEYLPIEWHEAFSILSQRRRASSATPDEVGGRSHRRSDVMLKDISLRTIPNMREFANDTLMDVLYFMSPEHHDLIIDVVANEMNVVVDKFRSITGFNGRISVVGHSLGSIISWDILANQEDKTGTRRGIPDVPSLDSLDTTTGYFSPATEKSYVYGYAPELTTPPQQPTSLIQGASTFPQLEFSVDNFFLLGSPVAVFLMIRDQRKPLSEDYFLPGCKRVFNIFHPYDPVAYRVEPCIDPRNADFEPSIMKHWNGGFRVQYQTKRLWRQLVDRTWKTQQNVVEAFEASMAKMGLIDSSIPTTSDDELSSSDVSSSDSRLNRVVTGTLNQGRRIDYMLQEREMENVSEYVFALAAHSSYWIEKDMSLFIARQIYLSTLEHAAEVDAAESWETLPTK